MNCGHEKYFELFYFLHESQLTHAVDAIYLHGEHSTSAQCKADKQKRTIKRSDLSAN